MKNKLTRHLKTHFLVYLIFIFFFVLRLALQSPWLEDWDSVQFSLGLHEYSIAKHQPHPPGYPFYILIGRLLYPIFQSDLKTLTFMSAFFGSLTVIPLYFLVKKMFDSKTAVTSALLLMIIPVHWILSETPISNITGLFFLVCFAYIVYIYEKDFRYWPLIGFIGGLILGVRLTDSPVVLGLLALLAIRNFHLEKIFILGISFILGILTWWIPLILISGYSNFSDSYGVIARWFADHESGITGTYGIKYYFRSKALNLLDHLNVSFTWNILIAVVVSVLTILPKTTRDFRYQFLLVWIISYGVILFTLYNLDLPQYTLPLSIPFAILIAYWLNKILTFKKVRFLFFPLITIAVILVVKYDLEQIIGHLKSTPPTISPVFYVKDKFSPKNTVLITTFTYRQFQYYAPEFTNYYGTEKLPSKIDAENVVVDYGKLRDELPVLKGYKIAGSVTFSEPKLYMPRIHQTNLYHLVKQDR